MARRPLYMTRVAGWELTTTAVNANSGDLQVILNHSAELGQIHEQFTFLSAQQAALTSSKQETTRLMQDLFRRGETLVDVIRTVVRQHYGKDSEKLVEFGLQPFRSRTRTPKTVPPGTESTAPADPSSDPDTTQ